VIPTIEQLDSPLAIELWWAGRVLSDSQELVESQAASDWGSLDREASAEDA
jgi:hypothetical protein